MIGVIIRCKSRIKLFCYSVELGECDSRSEDLDGGSST